MSIAITRITNDAQGFSGNDSSDQAAFSADGTKVVFRSLSGFGGGTDANGVFDVFIVDSDGTSLVRLSAVGPDAANGASQSPSITGTGDGIRVLFLSAASNLGDGDDLNNSNDVFVVDADGSNLLRLSSVGADAANGASFPVGFSADGSKVLFNSTATNLGGGTEANGNGLDAFVINTNGTGLVRLSSGGDADSFAAGFSSDGTKVLMGSNAGNLGAGIDNNASTDVFVVDAGGGNLVRLSSADGNAADGESAPVAFSPDGSKVLFISTATNLVTGNDTNSDFDVFVVNTDGSNLVRLSTVGGNAGNGFSEPIAFSPNGSKVLFRSTASDLGGGTDSNGNYDVFVVDVDGNNLVRLSTVGGNAGNGFSEPIGFSPDGSKVLFSSTASDLVGNDTNGATDVFVVNVNGTGLLRLSSFEGNAANGASLPIGFSPDGSKVLFSSTATNLGGGTDGNGATDVFVVNEDGSGLQRISSVGANAANGASLPIGFSPDGSKVLFSSTASNLAPMDLVSQDLFVATLTPPNTPPVLDDAAASVSELAPLGTLVIDLDATDTDLPAQALTYSISAGNAGGLFDINATTGAVTLAAAPDFETNAAYALTIEVSDGTVTDSATLSITVSNAMPSFNGNFADATFAYDALPQEWTITDGTTTLVFGGLETAVTFTDGVTAQLVAPTGHADVAAALAAAQAAGGGAIIEADGSRTLLVDDDHSSPFATLTAALAAAQAADEILVFPGDYTESTNAYAPNTPLGLWVRPELDGITIRGVDATGAAITDRADIVATISAAANSQSIWGTNFFVEASDVTIQGLTFLGHRGPDQDFINKVFEITDGGFTLTDSIVGGVAGVAMGSTIYIADWILPPDLTGFVSTIESYTIDDNELRGEVVIANGAGVGALAGDLLVTNNDFVLQVGQEDSPYGVILPWGLVLNGADPNTPWLLAPIQFPIATGNDFSADVEILLRHRTADASTLPDLSGILDFLSTNSTAGYTYVTDATDALKVEEVGGIARIYVTTRAESLNAVNFFDTVYGLEAGDTVVTKVLADGDAFEVLADDITVAPEADGGLLEITLNDAVVTVSLAGGEDVNVTGGAAGNVIVGNAGDNEVDGAGGIDTFDAAPDASVVFNATLGQWQAVGGSNGTDTLTSVGVVQVNPTFLLVGGGGDFASIQAALDYAADPLNGINAASTTVLVAPGVIDAGFVVAASLAGITIAGPNAGIAGTGPRGTEAVVTGSSTISAANVTIDGLRFQIDGAATAGLTDEAVMIQGSGAVVENTVFERSGGTTADSWAAIRVQANDATVQDNLFTQPVGNGFGPSRAGWNHGIYGDTPDSADMQVLGNTFNLSRTAVGADYLSAATLIDGNTTNGVGTGVAVGGPSVTGFDYASVITNNSFGLVPTGTTINLQNIPGDVIFNTPGSGNTGSLGGSPGVLLLGSPLGNDTLSGDAGNDVLTGRAGNDALDGNAGLDVAVFSVTPSFTGTSLNWASTTATGADGTDTLNDIEFLAVGATITPITASMALPFSLAASPDQVVKVEGTFGGTFGTGFAPGLGWDPTRSAGDVEDSVTVSPNSSIALGANNNATTVGVVEFSWSSGLELLNGAGDELIVYEAGGPGAPEAFAVAVLVDGVWSDYRYEFSNGFQTESTVGSGHFWTGFDLADFGVGAGEAVSAVRIRNLIASDLVSGADGQGVVGTTGFTPLTAPGGLGYAADRFDADITFLGVLNGSVTEIRPDAGPDLDATVLENRAAGTVVADINATDDDAITYSLVNDFGRFAIDANGVITTTAPLDFETASSYLLEVVASDGVLSDIAQVAVTVADLGDITFSQNSTPGFASQVRTPGLTKEAVAGTTQAVPRSELTTAGVLTPTGTNATITTDAAGATSVLLNSAWNTLKNVFVADDDGGTYTLTKFAHTDVTLGGSADSVLTVAQAKRGTIATADGDDNITVTAFSNGAGAGNTFSIYSGAGNDSITLTGWASFTVTNIGAGEGADSITLNGNTADTVDAGAGNDTVFAGQGSDTLDGGADFDTAVFAHAFAAYSFTVTVPGTVQSVGPDGTKTWTRFESFQFTDQTVALAGLVNVAPELAAGPLDLQQSVAEGAGSTGFAVGFAIATDANLGDLPTFSLTDDAGGAFTIDSESGLVSVLDGSLLDFESGGSVSITVRATDPGGLSDEQTYILTITDVNEPLTNITPLAASIAENAAAATVVADLDAIDEETFDTIDWTLLDSAGGRFLIDANGVVTVAAGATFDHETEGTITLVVQAADSFPSSVVRNLVVTVTDVPEAPTDITLSNASVNENAPASTLVGTLGATDPDLGETFTFALLDNAGGRFAIAGNTLVTTGVLLNFEATPSLDVTVEVTDSDGLTRAEVFTIALNNLNEAPTDLALPPATVNENAANGTIVGTLTPTDPDVTPTQTFSYSLLNNAGGRFAINPTTGAISVANGLLLNFENAASHTVTAQVTDQGGLSYAEAFTISVADLNEAPTAIGSSGLSVAENSANGTVVGILGATDPDTVPQTFNFSLLNNAGGRFAIVGTELRVANGGLLDFEINTSHTVTVRVTDQGGLSRDQNLVVGVTDVAEGSDPGIVTFSQAFLLTPASAHTPNVAFDPALASSTTLTAANLAALPAPGANVLMNVTSGGALLVDLTSAFNTVKNVSVADLDFGTVTIDNFVQADVALGNGGNSAVTFTAVKRGSISTGNGNDTINVTNFSNVNDGAVNNTTRINSGNGNDTIDLWGWSNHSTSEIRSGLGADTIRLNTQNFDNVDRIIWSVGHAAGDLVRGFDGGGASALDQLRFEGFGPGASLTHGGSGLWTVTYNGGASSESFTLQNATGGAITALNANDFLFV